MKILGKLFFAVLFGAIGLGIGHLVYNGLCSFFRNVCETGPGVIIYAPYYLCGGVGFLCGLGVGSDGEGGCVGLAAIPLVALLFLVVLVIAIIVGAIFEQQAFIVIPIILGLFGGGYVIYIIFR